MIRVRYGTFLVGDREPPSDMSYELRIVRGKLPDIDYIIMMLSVGF